MLNGTLSVFKSMMKGHVRLLSLGILTLASGVIFSTSLMAAQDLLEQSKTSLSKCDCRNAQKGPQGNQGPAGPQGDSVNGGLVNYASFIQAAPVPIGKEEAIPFGTLVAGSAGPQDAISGTANNSMFELATGDYLISVGVSLFGTTGNQLEITLNGKPIYSWPLNPLVTPRDFIELTFMLEVTAPNSLLTFSMLNGITPPSGAAGTQNYLSIEQVFSIN